MSHRLIATLFVALVATACHAEPLDWAYTATITAVGGADHLLVGSQRYPLDGNDDTWPEHYFLLPMQEYAAKAGRVYPGEWDMLYTFGPGGPLEIVTTLPATVGAAGFEVTMTFTDAAGNSGTVSQRGGVSASGLLTSGTGNFDVSFDGTREVELGGRRARVTFGDGYFSESGVYTTFQVDELSPSETPEPGTLILGGIALAGGVGAWRRKRRMANAG
jgi:hypothetical protein